MLDIEDLASEFARLVKEQLEKRGIVLLSAAPWPTVPPGNKAHGRIIQLPRNWWNLSLELLSSENLEPSAVLLAAAIDAESEGRPIRTALLPAPNFPSTTVMVGKGELRMRVILAYDISGDCDAMRGDVAFAVVEQQEQAA